MKASRPINEVKNMIKDLHDKLGYDFARQLDFVEFVLNNMAKVPYYEGHGLPYYDDEY